MKNEKHVPVLLNEVISLLDLQTGKTVVDGTVNRGGHAKEICKQIGATGTLIGIDLDQGALDEAKEKLKDTKCKVILEKDSFRNLDEILAKNKIEKVKSKKQVKLEGLSKLKLLIKGDAASPGIIWGPPRLIKSAKEISKVKEGDVLVTRMTTPDFVPAMKRAVAIVTDKGGQTSHAAIVSRELGVPCVIGTRIATKVFKDGDVVAVDANTGLVKIIDKANRHN